MNGFRKPTRNQITEATLTNLLERYSPFKCWKVGLYYGSMVYFEFGDVIKEEMSDGTSNEIGTSTLILNGDDWKIWDNDIVIAKSETVTRGFAETALSDKFIGQNLKKIELDRGTKKVVITFSECRRIDICTNLETDETFHEDDSIFSLTLPNGDILFLNMEGNLMVGSGEDNLRQSNWQRSH